MASPLRPSGDFNPLCDSLSEKDFDELAPTISSDGSLDVDLTRSIIHCSKKPSDPKSLRGRFSVGAPSTHERLSDMGKALSQVAQEALKHAYSEPDRLSEHLHALGCLSQNIKVYENVVDAHNQVSEYNPGGPLVKKEEHLQQDIEACITSLKSYESLKAELEKEIEHFSRPEKTHESNLITRFNQLSSAYNTLTEEQKISLKGPMSLFVEQSKMRCLMEMMNRFELGEELLPGFIPALMEQLDIPEDKKEAFVKELSDSLVDVIDSRAFEDDLEKCQDVAAFTTALKLSAVKHVIKKTEAYSSIPSNELLETAKLHYKIETVLERHILKAYKETCEQAAEMGLDLSLFKPSFSLRFFSPVITAFLKGPEAKTKQNIEHMMSECIKAFTEALKTEIGEFEHQRIKDLHSKRTQEAGAFIERPVMRFNQADFGLDEAAHEGVCFGLSTLANIKLRKTPLRDPNTLEDTLMSPVDFPKAPSATPAKRLNPKGRFFQASAWMSALFVPKAPYAPRRDGFRVPEAILKKEGLTYETLDPKIERFVTLKHGAIDAPPESVLGRDAESIVDALNQHQDRIDRAQGFVILNTKPYSASLGHTLLLEMNPKEGRYGILDVNYGYMAFPDLQTFRSGFSLFLETRYPTFNEYRPYLYLPKSAAS